MLLMLVLVEKSRNTTFQILWKDLNMASMKVSLDTPQLDNYTSGVG